MSSEAELRLKLRKIEALFEGAGTDGEKVAAGEAIKRIKEKLTSDSAIEYTFTLQNLWSTKLFIALCRRYSLYPYRYARQRHTTVMVKAPKRFVDTILWPQYEALDEELCKYLNTATEKIISEEVYQDTTDVQEKDPLLI